MSDTHRHHAPAPHRSWGRAAFLIGVAVVVSSCSSSGRQANDPFREGGSGQRVRVEVQNNNFNDASIFAIRSGARTRLGDVTGKTTDTFTFNWPISHPLEFSVQLVGGASCRIRAPAIDPGDDLWIRIPSDMGLSRCRGGKR